MPAHTKKLDQLRAAWAAAAEALHIAERAEQNAEALRSEREAQRRYVAILAHELKNPLNAIYGYTQLLQQRDVPSDIEGRARKLSTIENATRHLIGLVGDILTNEQIESSNFAIDPEEFEVAPLIDEVAALERSVIEINGNSFDLPTNRNLGTITSDRQRIAQILINLLSNAAKFTRNGRISVTVIRDEDRSLRIIVADTGSGIAPEQKAQLFEAFAAIGGKEARLAGGHGLGLHVTAALVNRLGGTISVESELGHGTCMTVWLPDMAARQHVRQSNDCSLLTIGFCQSLPALDPMLQQVDADAFFLDSVYECLTRFDDHGRIVPALAISWEQVDPLTWRLQLDRTAAFQNGDRFGAEDVIATYRRLRRMLDDPTCEIHSNSPDLEELSAIDQHTIMLKSRTPAPLFLQQLATIPIIHRSCGHLAVGDFTLKHAIGTGPYRLVDYGAHGLRLIAHPRPGQLPARWNIVIGRRLRAALETEEALLSGRVDVAPHVGHALAKRLRQSPSTHILRPPTDTALFLQPNLVPHARGMAWWPDGSPIDANPLTDMRVRRAISLAIDRDFLVSHALMGEGAPLASPVLGHFFGAETGLRPDAYSPEVARELLKSAGYPDGLTLAVKAVDDIESPDRQIVRALHAPLASCGIRLKASYGPLRDFSYYDPNPTFGLLLSNWIPELPDAEMILRDFVASFDPSQGYGACNYGHISVPEIDEALHRAACELDRNERSRLLKTVCRIIAQQYLLIPVAQPFGCVAYRSHLNIVGRYHMWPRPDQVIPRLTEQPQVNRARIPA